MGARPAYQNRYQVRRALRVHLGTLENTSDAVPQSIEIGKFFIFPIYEHCLDRFFKNLAKQAEAAEAAEPSSRIIEIRPIKLTHQCAGRHERISRDQTHKFTNFENKQPHNH
jgi:hypothetical protein